MLSAFPLGAAANESRHAVRASIWTGIEPATYNPRRYRMTASDLNSRRDSRRRAKAERRELNAALRQRQPHAFGTWLLLAVNIAMFVPVAVAGGRTGGPAKALRWGALFAPDVADGEWWRLFTAAWLHVHPPHLVFNMAALAMVAPVLERLLGTRTVLAFYVAAALVGNAVSLWMHPITPSVGASGAIMGLYGVLLAVMFERESSPQGAPEEQAPFASRFLLHGHLQAAVSMIATTLLFGWFDRRVDNAAHLGGLLAGGVFGWMAGRDIEWRRPSRQVAGAALGVALGCCAVGLATQRDITDARAALIEVFTMDSRATARYSTLARSGNDAATITRTIEQEILPAFSRERVKLESIGQVPPDQEQIVADLRHYLVLRESYWRQRAAAGDRTDASTRQQLDAADESANVVMRRLLRAR
jgi:rhomboid protease GluP